MTPAERYEAAFRTLCQNTIAENTAGITVETPEFLKAARAVSETRPGISGWRRIRIDRRVLRELDYWKRIRESSR